jgi:hypothetical protein
MENTGWNNQNPKFLHSLEWKDAELGIHHTCHIRENDIDSLWVGVNTVIRMIVAKKQSQGITYPSVQEKRKPQPQAQEQHKQPEKVDFPEWRDYDEEGVPIDNDSLFDASYCRKHGVSMRSSKEGDGYYHKAGEKEDGKAIWCRGK